jgi:two-component system cell cycle sensor histidine kinase/response regulator CckA
MSGKRTPLSREALDSALNALLAEYPTAFVAAINADGVLVPMPASVPLRGQQVLKARSGIDLVVPEDQQLVIATWERARETGASSAQVRLKLDPGRPAVIHYVDARAIHGVYVGIVVGGDAAALTSVPEVRPAPPRMTRVCKNEVAVFTEVDEAITTILGWTTADMVGIRSLDFIHPEDQERAIESWMQMLSEPGTAQPPVRLRHRRSDGSWAWFEVTNHNLLADPDRGYVLTEMIDISDEMAAQEALRASEVKYRTLFEESFDGLFITSPAGRILDMNRKGVAMFGYDTKEEVLRLDLERDVYVRPPDRARILAMVQASGSAEYEVDVKKKNGELMTTLCAITAVPDEDGVISSYRGIIRDITERKREEEALHRLNRELRAISSCNQILMRAEDEQTLLNDICRIVCDQAGHRMAWVGYAENDDAKAVRPVASAGFDDGYLASVDVTWADTERGRGATGTAIRSGSTCIQDFTTDPRAAPWRENAQQVGYRSSIALPLKDRGANTFGALTIYSTEPNAFTQDETRLLEELARDLAFGIGTLRDHVERDQAEEALRDSERRYREIFDNVTDTIFVFDVTNDGRFRFAGVNAASTELSGVSNSAASGKFLEEVVRPEVVASSLPYFRHCVETGEVLRYEEVYSRPAGGQSYLSKTLIPVRETTGSVCRLIVVTSDITERKRAEEGRLARLRFAEGMDRVNRAILGTDDLDHMMRDTLDAVLGLFGCDRAWLFYPCDPDASTFRVPMEVTNPEYPGAGMLDVDVPLSPDMAENLREALESAGPVTYVAGTAKPINRVSAEQFGVQSQMFSALYPKSAKPWAFGIHQCSHPRVWTSEDEDLFKEIGRRLTDALTSLLARRDLQRSEGEYRRIVDTASEGIWVVGPDDGTTFVNARMADMLSRSTDDMIGRPLTDFMFEEDAPDHAARMEARRRGISEHDERRFRRQDGQPLWTLVSATPIFDDEDRFAGSFAMLTDITERHRAEEEARTLNRELERQVLQYRMLLDQASDAIFVTDADRHYVDVNIAACDLLGYSREELLRLSIPNLVPPEENPGQPERFVRMRSGEAMLSERTLRRKDGSLLVAELSSRQLPDGRFQAIVRDITARRLLEKDQARLATAVEQADEAIVITDPSSSILYVNPSFERVSGYTRAELIGRNPRILHSGQHDAAFYQAMWSTLLAGQTWHGALMNRRKDGSLFEEDAAITPIRDAAGAVVSYVGVKRDITRERFLEAQLRQSQKMEAVGQLAGGIAHDFNNLITAIRGYSELVRESLPPGDRDDIDQVVLAADRAAELTRQMLAFSRRQVLQPRIVGPAEIVEGIAPMLRRLLGEHIELTVHAAPDVGHIRVDPSGLEQIIVNLAVNARDAMPGGGRLVIETTNAEIDVRSQPAHAEMTPGPYVVLRVTDTGCGMDEGTRARAFEPFFTTKEPGSGTGMGLATVYGIVRQSGGEIDLHSGLGQGTTFEIYLPRVDEEAITVAVTTEAAAVPRGSETILLVEDEGGVRTFARRVLEELGYTVLEASDGVEATEHAATHTGRIDLLVTDVVMPRMGGPEVAERLRAARPGLPILFMSGFPGNAVGGADLTQPGAPVLAKPFTREGLGRAVRGALETDE